MENIPQKHRSQSVESGSADLPSPSVTHRAQQIVHTPNSFSPSTDRTESDSHPNKRKASASSDGHLRSPSIPMSDPHDHKRLKGLENTSPIRSKSPGSVNSGTSSVAQSQNSRSAQVAENPEAQVPRDLTRVSSEGASLPRINSEYSETAEPVTSSEQAQGQRGILDYGPGLRNSPQPSLSLPSIRLPSMSSSFPSLHSGNTSPPLQASGAYPYSANSVSPSGSAGGPILASTYEGRRSSSPKPSFPPIRNMAPYSREVPILPPISASNLDSESQVLGGSKEYEERKLVDYHQPLVQFSSSMKAEEQGSNALAQMHPNAGHGTQMQPSESQLRAGDTGSMETNIPQTKYPEAETASEEEEEIMETGGVVNRDQSVVSSRGETPLSFAEPPEEASRQKVSKRAMDSENGFGSTPQLIIRNNKLYDVMKSEDFHLGYTVYSPFTTLPILEGKENGLLEVRVPGIYLSFGNSKVRKQAIWGTDVYTDDSDVVAALIHSGFYTPPMPNLVNGDLKLAMKNIESLPHANHDLSVTIRVMPKLIKYASTVRYRIKSREWGDHDGVSFKIESVKVLKFGEALRKGRKQRKEFIRANELTRQRVMNCVMTNNPHVIYTGLYETSVTIVFNRNNAPCYKYRPNLILALKQEDAEEAPVWNFNRFGQDTLCLENNEHSYHLTRAPKSESTEDESPEHYRLTIHALNAIDTNSDGDFVDLLWNDIAWVDQGMLITSKCEPHQIELLRGQAIPEGVLIPVQFMYWITPEIIDRVKAARLEKELAQKATTPIAQVSEDPAPPVVEPEAEIKAPSPEKDSTPMGDSQDNAETESIPVETKPEPPLDQVETTTPTTEDQKDSEMVEDTILDVVMADSAAVTDEAEVPIITQAEEATDKSEEKEPLVQSEKVEADLPANPQNDDVPIAPEAMEEAVEEAGSIEKANEPKPQEGVEVVIEKTIDAVATITDPAPTVESNTPHEVHVESPEHMDIAENGGLPESSSEKPEENNQSTDTPEIQADVKVDQQVDVEMQDESTADKPDRIESEVEEGEIDSEVGEINEESQKKEETPEVLEAKPEDSEQPKEEPKEAPAVAEQPPEDSKLKPPTQAEESISEPSQSEAQPDLEVSGISVNGDEKRPSLPDELPEDKGSEQAVKEFAEAHEPKEDGLETTETSNDVVLAPNDNDGSVEIEKAEEGEILPSEVVSVTPSEPEPETSTVEQDVQEDAGKKEEPKDFSEELEAGEISPEAMDIDPVVSSKSNGNNDNVDLPVDKSLEKSNLSDAKQEQEQEPKDESIEESAKDGQKPADSPMDTEPGEIDQSARTEKDRGELEGNDGTANSPNSKEDSDMEEGEIDDDDDGDGGLSDPRSSVRSTQSTYRGPDFKYKNDDFRKAGVKDKGDKPYGFYDRPERFKERFDYRRDERKFERGRDRAEEYKPYRREDRPRDRARYERRDDIPGSRSRNERYDRFAKSHERSTEPKEPRNRPDKEYPDSSKPHGSASSDNEEGELTDQPSPSANMSKSSVVRSSHDSSRRPSETSGNDREHDKDGHHESRE